MSAAGKGGENFPKRGNGRRTGLHLGLLGRQGIEAHVQRWVLESASCIQVLLVRNHHVRKNLLQIPKLSGEEERSHAEVKGNVVMPR